MGKYDEDFAKFYPKEDEMIEIIPFFLYKMCNELAEANRLTRQKLTMVPGTVIDIEDAVDKA